MNNRILVVDDEAVCTMFLSLALQEEGFDVKTAVTADEAIRVGEEFKPHVLITDWMLKDAKDGLHVTRHLTSQLPEMRVIFITGMAREIIRSQLGDTKCDGIVIKPIDLDEILKMIRQFSATGAAATVG